MPKIHCKSHKPDFALFVFEFVDDSGGGFSLAEMFVLQPARFPANYTVFAGLTQYKVSKPFYTVHVVSATKLPLCYCSLWLCSLLIFINTEKFYKTYIIVK